MYKISSLGGFIRTTDNTSFPASAENIDYQRFLAWVAQGNSPLPADLEPEPVFICSAYQIREALNQLGWRNDVEAAISSGSQSLKDAWLFSELFASNNAKIAEIATEISKTAEDITTLFELAVTLQP
jgi:hypothetical protein